MRRRIIVNKRFQISHLLNIILIMGAGALLLSFPLAWFFLGFFDSRLDFYGIHDGCFVCIGAFFILILSGAIWSTLYTRSIAGQMKKMAIMLEKASMDEVPERGSVKFRDDDRFRWLASSMEACFDNIRTKMAHIRQNELLKSEIKIMLTEGKHEEALLCLIQDEKK